MHRHHAAQWWWKLFLSGGQVDGQRPENRGASKAPRGVGCGEEYGDCPSPENFEFFDLQMVCFGVFCGTKFNILAATKSCKNHTLNA